MQPQEFAGVLQQNGQLPGVVAEVASSRAVAVVLGKVKVVDTEGNEVDLSDFTAQGEEEDGFDVSAATQALQDANDHEGHNH